MESVQRGGGGSNVKEISQQNDNKMQRHFFDF